jgi:hypothetical protein
MRSNTETQCEVNNDTSETYHLSFMLVHSPMDCIDPRLIVPSVVSFANIVALQFLMFTQQT